MATIKTDFGEGGANLTGSQGETKLSDALRDVADDFTSLRTQFIALLAKLDTEMTLEELIELANDIGDKYEAHRILTTGSQHANADTVNALASPPATDLASVIVLLNDIKAKVNAHLIAPSEVEEAITLLNELKVDFNAHRILTGGGEHTNADTTNAVTAADATDQATAITLANDLKAQLNAHNAAVSELEEAITLLNEIKVDYEAHRQVAAPVHNGADAANAVTAPDATDLGTAITLANDIKTQYEAHRVDNPAVHNNADTANAISAANASDHGTLITLANDLRATYEGHRQQVAGPPDVHDAEDSTNVVSAVAAGTAAIHLVDDTTNVVVAANATNFATLKTLANEIRTDYEAHRQDVSSHGAADATNTVSAVAMGTAGIHQTDDVTNTVSSADATTQATAKTLANEIRADYEAHRQDTTSHAAADTTNVVAEPAAATDYEATLTPDALLTIKG